MFGIVVEVQGRPAGLHSRAEPRGQDEKGAMGPEWSIEDNVCFTLFHLVCKFRYNGYE